MKAAIFITFLSLFSSIKPTWTLNDEEEVTQETMINNIMERMARMEADMKTELETRDQRISLLD